MARLEPVLEHAESDFENAVSRYLTFLRIPSISTDPAYKNEVRRAGSWLEEQLRSLGFEATLYETPGHPILLAYHEGATPGAPHLLYYGHYDVQPPEPLDLWESPPFEPAIVDGPHGKRVVARGAVDDKGQVMTFLEAFPRLEGGPWRRARGRYGASRRRRGERKRLAARLSGEACGDAARGVRRHHHRHQRLGHRHARDHLPAAGECLCGSDAQRPFA